MNPLDAFGWNDRLAELFDQRPDPATTPGRVARVHRINCDVATADGEVVARPGPSVEQQIGAPLPAAGDWVAVRPAPGAEDGDELLVDWVLPRWSAITRRDPADRTTRQVLAANVDVVLVVHGLDQELNLRRIERSLVLAHASGAEPVVVLTKADLVDDADEVAERVRAVALDADLIVASGVTGHGIAALLDHARPDRTLALIGASGAGKSTLVNALVGDEVQDTGAVREGDAKGRHTTIRRELVPLPGGGVLIDTPGLRGLGLWDAEEGVALAFADIEDLATRCRFRDCAHEHEPGCAVKAAIESGDLDARRLESYRRLVDEIDELEQRQEEARRRRRGRRRRPPSGGTGDDALP